MIIKKLTVGQLFTNCYLVADDNGNGVVIDPGELPDHIINEALDNKIQIQAVWLTHGHFDHMMAASEIINVTNAELFVSANDEKAINDPRLNLLAYVSPNRLSELKATNTLQEGDILKVGDLEFEVMETPGHTPGSICFICKKEHVLFSGDTLFAGGSFGRTDLPGGNEQSLQESLKRLSEIKEFYHVYPGHGEDFTIGEAT